MKNHSVPFATLNNAKWVFILMVILSIGMRFFTFFPSVIDHDESTYLVIAKSLLKGGVLYKDYVDIKPVGIFYIIAGYLKVFGDSIFLFRMFGALIVATTSFLIYKIQRNFGYSNTSAFAGGVIYIAFLSIWTHFGAAINTEHFFNLTTALALFVISKRTNTLNIAVASFILGIGFLIKIVDLFDFTAFMLYFLIQHIKQKQSWVKIIPEFISYGILFVLPFAIVNLVFFWTGNYDTFAKIHFETFGNYPQEHHFTEMLIWILSFMGRFLPISIFFWISLFKKSTINQTLKNEKLFYLLWLSLVLISILLPGKTFAHYTIQLMLPMSLVAGQIFDARNAMPIFLKPLFKKHIAVPLLVLLFIGNAILQWKDHYKKPDYPKDVSAYLKTVMNADDKIYTGNTQHIIYFLLDKTPLTPYVHRTILFRDIHLKALELNQQKEFEHIFAQKPEFVLEKESMNVAYVQKMLLEDYSVKKYFDKYNLKVYVRNDYQTDALK